MNIPFLFKNMFSTGHVTDTIFIFLKVPQKKKKKKKKKIGYISGWIEIAVSAFQVTLRNFSMSLI